MNTLEALAKATLNEPSPYVCELLKFNAAANPETILALIALLRDIGEALEIHQELTRPINGTQRVLAKYEEMTNGN